LHVIIKYTIKSLFYTCKERSKIRRENEGKGKATLAPQETVGTV